MRLGDSSAPLRIPQPNASLPLTPARRRTACATAGPDGVEVVVFHHPGGIFSEPGVACCRPSTGELRRPNLVANAGLVLVATLAVRLELEAVVNRMAHLGGRVGGAKPGRKVLTVPGAAA